MAYLFDTNAISEALRHRPNPEFTYCLRELPREDQFTSTVVLAELYVAAHRSARREQWLRRIEEEILLTMTILPFGLECARMYGRVSAQLLDAGTPIGDVDTQIAATALYHRLTVVTANIRHFERVDALSLYRFTPGRPA